MERMTNFKSYDWTSNLSAMYRNHSHADVTLVCEGKKILAHRSVLASLSPLFGQLLLGCESSAEQLIFLEGFRYAVMVCLVNFLYNGIAEGSSDDLVTVSKYAKELQVKGLVNSGHSTQPFQLVLLEKRKVEEQLEKLQSDESDSDSSSEEDEDLQIVFEKNIQESFPVQKNEAAETTDKSCTSEVVSKRKRSDSQSCTTARGEKKKLVLAPILGATELSSKSTLPIKVIKCSICKEIFANKADLRIHLRNHHSEQLTCGICSILFSSRVTLKRHLKKHISSLNGLLGSLSTAHCPA
ncbi:putative longitudils lacking protein [Daphnia sinensis]|uniref:Longitudils lacking protein n=1 Tax=Daphnia sinensis TaxID=1820382 RepID=A0AAD5LBX8_9CRUS|nr:putative longitudils lacking protein [Daphnia sinensis]